MVFAKPSRSKNRGALACALTLLLLAGCKGGSGDDEPPRASDCIPAGTRYVQKLTQMLGGDCDESAPLPDFQVRVESDGSVTLMEPVVCQGERGVRECELTVDLDCRNEGGLGVVELGTFDFFEDLSRANGRVVLQVFGEATSSSEGDGQPPEVEVTKSSCTSTFEATLSKL